MAQSLRSPIYLAAVCGILGLCWGPSLRASDLFSTERGAIILPDEKKGSPEEKKTIAFLQENLGKTPGYNAEAFDLLGYKLNRDRPGLVLISSSEGGQIFLPEEGKEKLVLTSEQRRELGDALTFRGTFIHPKALIPYLRDALGSSYGYHAKEFEQLGFLRTEKSGTVTYSHPRSGAVVVLPVQDSYRPLAFTDEDRDQLYAALRGGKFVHPEVRNRKTDATEELVGKVRDELGLSVEYPVKELEQLGFVKKSGVGVVEFDHPRTGKSILLPNPDGAALAFSSKERTQLEDALRGRANFRHPKAETAFTEAMIKALLDPSGKPIGTRPEELKLLGFEPDPAAVACTFIHRKLKVKIQLPSRDADPQTFTKGQRAELEDALRGKASFIHPDSTKSIKDGTEQLIAGIKSEIATASDYQEASLKRLGFRRSLEVDSYVKFENPSTGKSISLPVPSIMGLDITSEEIGQLEQALRGKGDFIHSSVKALLAQ